MKNFLLAVLTVLGITAMVGLSAAKSSGATSATSPLVTKIHAYHARLEAAGE